MALSKIAVCVKQIPLIDEVNFDPVTKTIKRDGPNVMNALDLNAVAYAVEFKQKTGAQTTVLTMGPPQAREVLVQALAMGIDQAVHLEDRAFAGADTLATARALAAWLKPRRFDLVLLGRYSLDAETGQVGPEIAELMGVAQVTNAVELTVGDNLVHAVRESDEGRETVECELPAVVTCAERGVRPPRVRPDALAAAKSAPVEIVRAADLGNGPEQFGAAGSPTWVKEVRIEKQPPTECRFIDTSDPRRAAQEVVAELDRLGALEPARASRRAVADGLRKPVAGRDVWVVYETDSTGKITHGSLELLSAADRLAGRLGGAVVAIGFEDSNLGPLLTSYGADRIVLIDHPALRDHRPEAISQALTALVGENRPFALLVNASEQGRDYGPRLAAALGLGLTGDAIGLEIDADGRMVALKPAFAGNVIAPILSRTYPQMATVRSGVLEMAEPNPARGSVALEIIRPHLPASKSRLLGSETTLDTSLKPLEGAEIVVGAGAGLGGPEGIERAKQFARATGAAMCATRRVTDLRWVPRQLQVGLTGKAIEPRLYFAIAIRGAPNHTIGLKRIAAIVAINSDREAPIFQRAHIGLVADWAQVLPALEEALSKRLARS